MGWILIGFALVALLDLYPLILTRHRRAIVTFCVIFVLALTLALLKFFDVNVPPILSLFDKLFNSIGLSYNPQRGG